MVHRQITNRPANRRAMTPSYIRKMKAKSTKHKAPCELYSRLQAHIPTFAKPEKQKRVEKMLTMQPSIRRAKCWSSLTHQVRLGCFACSRSGWSRRRPEIETTAIALMTFSIRINGNLDSRKPAAVKQTRGRSVNWNPNWSLSNGGLEELNQRFFCDLFGR